jgi:hypothetical protein
MTDELKVGSLTGVEILDVGTWDGITGRFEVTEADLDELIENFATLKGTIDPPGKLGHDEGQGLLQEDGYPACGWVSRLYKRGTKLVADFEGVPGRLLAVIKAGGYRKTSVEVWNNFRIGAERYGKVLVGVAFLGAELPAVSTLDDILALYASHADIGIDKTTNVRTFVFPKKEEDRPMTTTRAAVADEEIDGTKLLDEMKTMREKAEKATAGKKGARSFRAFLGETIRRLEEFLTPKSTATKARAERMQLSASDWSDEQRRDAVQDAITDAYMDPLDTDEYVWIVSMYDDRAIVSKGGEKFAVPYTIADDGAVTLGTPIAVEQAWVPAASSESLTTARSKKNAGTTGKEADMAISKAIALALGLPENADEPTVLTAIGKIQSDVTKFAAADQRVLALEARDRERDASDAVKDAIRARKLAPAQREWAMTYASKDLAGFKAYLEKTPAIFTDPKGHEGEAPEPKPAATEINELIVAAMKADTAGTLTFVSAMDRVVRENPELAKRYVEERGSSARLS